MPQSITTVDEFHRYLRNVRHRADHHAENVNSVILALAGAAVLFKDEGTALECRSYRGETANVMYISINGNRYAFSYNHEDQTVEIRRGSIQGNVVAEFDNATSTTQIIELFRRL